MKIRVTEPLLDYENKPIKKEDGKDLTVREAIAIALNNYLSTETPTAEQKAKSFQISLKLYIDKDVDLTLDDRMFIKERAGVILGVVPLGRLSEILEGAEKPDAQKTN